MSSISISEMFYRLFRASWLPGQDTLWRVYQTISGTQVRLPDLPFDGLVLDFLAMIFALLLIDWMLKALRRYS